MDTERRLERYRGADRWPTEEALGAMLENQLGALLAVRQALPALSDAVEATATRLRAGDGRLVYVGAGASGRFAVQDGVELWPTFGWPHERLLYLIAGGEAALVQSREGAEDDGDAGRGLIAEHRIGTADVVVGLAASGTTSFTRAAIVAARERGALTIGMANNPAAPLLAEAEHGVLLQSGPEFLAGSTRMCAGTAQKIALNLFSTQTMTELGRVYDGLMVNVVASNAKLVERGRRMVQTITGCSEKAARAAHEAAGHDVKTAVLMVDGLSLAQARASLAQADGNLRLVRDSDADAISET
jgi:N-acetylmuramic acid 6-phosphate etherase